MLIDNKETMNTEHFTNFSNPPSLQLAGVLEYDIRSAVSTEVYGKFKVTRWFLRTTSKKPEEKKLSMYGHTILRHILEFLSI